MKAYEKYTIEELQNIVSPKYYIKIAKTESRDNFTGMVNGYKNLYQLINKSDNFVISQLTNYRLFVCNVLTIIKKELDKIKNI